MVLLWFVKFYVHNVSKRNRSFSEMAILTCSLPFQSFGVFWEVVVAIACVVRYGLASNRYTLIASTHLPMCQVSSQLVSVFKRSFRFHTETYERGLPGERSTTRVLFHDSPITDHYWYSSYYQDRFMIPLSLTPTTLTIRTASWFPHHWPLQLLLLGPLHGSLITDPYYSYY